MIEFKGTKGPWKVTRLAIWTEDGKTAIADTWDQQGDYPTKLKAQENSKLIAASPDLLEALQVLYNSIDSCVELTPKVLLQAKTAINKALTPLTL